MKTYAVGLILVVLFTCQQLSKALPKADEKAAEAVKKIMGECIKESGVSDAESKLILADKMDDIPEKDFTPNMKCFLLCFYKKLNLFDATGKPIPQNLAEFLNARFEKLKDQVKPAMAKCATVTDPNPCEMAFKYEVCISNFMDEKAG